MSSESPSHPNYKLHKKLMRRRAIRESWPLFVWLGIAVLAVWAYKTGADFKRMRGVVNKPVDLIVAPVSEPLIPLTDAEGNEKIWKQGDRVERGEVVARFDTTLIEREIEAEKQQAQFDSLKELSQLRLLQEQQKGQLQTLKNEGERIAGSLGAQRKRRDELEKRSLDPRAQLELSQVNAEIGTLEVEVRTNQNNQATMEQSVREIGEDIKGLREEVNLRQNPDQNQRLKLLEAQKARYEIKAQHSGYIDLVHIQPGHTVRTGDPIIEIVIDQPKSIKAMIPEANALDLAIGQKIYIAIPNNRKEFVTAQILSMQQSLSQIPDYASPIRGRMHRGRMIELGNIDGGAEGTETQFPLLPGSEVVISLSPPGRIPFLSFFNQ